jgi:acetylornithine deacetylase/succinyl-diaminopimelate desuccinylase-like protein
MKPSSLAPCLLAFALAPPLAAQTDRGSLQDETLRRLQEYLRIDTTNPPGNETRGTRYLGGLLEAAGIEYEKVESAPGRGNLWARLEGGDEPALLLLHHIDVVPADPEHWTVDPLSGEIRAGWIYGRGALDTKGGGMVQLQAFLALARSGAELNRDVIYMATADEEAGGFMGVGWLVENRPELFQGVGFVLNEGGGGTRDGDRVSFQVEVTQKVPLWLRLVAEDAPSHGSTPHVTSAVTRLVRALQRLSEHRFEPRVVPAVGALFRALADSSEPAWRDAFADIEGTIRSPDLLLKLQLEQPRLHALLRNTCSITMLEGSSKINVVPPDASAQVDCRLLPDQDPEAFVELLGTVLNDPAIRIERIMSFTPAVSPADTPLFEAIARVCDGHFPGARVFPGVLTGFTDSHFLRDLGIVAYGFMPLVTPIEEARRFHGNDERIAVADVRRGVVMMLEILEAFATD